VEAAARGQAEQQARGGVAAALVQPAPDPRFVGGEGLADPHLPETLGGDHVSVRLRWTRGGRGRIRRRRGSSGGRGRRGSRRRPRRGRGGVGRRRGGGRDGRGGGRRLGRNRRVEHRRVEGARHT